MAMEELEGRELCSVSTGEPVIWTYTVTNPTPMLLPAVQAAREAATR
jgi:hypothetical protein